jgi:parallel beta-helix repeat protein
MIVAAADGGFWRREGGVVATPRMFGATPGTEATAQIQAALNSALVKTVDIDAVYGVSGSLTVPSGKALRGAGGKLLGDPVTTQDHIMIEVAATGIVDGVELDGRWVADTAKRGTGIHCAQPQFQVRGCHVHHFGQKGVWVHGAPDHWGAITLWAVSDNHVHDCGEQGINAEYTGDGRISGNRVYAAKHGIQWWGGDGGVDGQPQRQRDLTITGNIVSNVVGGGIWGSCGANITVSGNNISGCGDVGIDYERSSGAATGNTVSDCVNGCLSIFYGGEGVTYSGNTVSQSASMPATAHGVWFANNAKARNITVIGNTITVLGAGHGVSGSALGTQGEIKVHGNTISTNTGRLIYVLYCNTWDVQGNTGTQQSSSTGLQTDGGNRWTIKNNKFTTLADPGTAGDVGGLLLNQKADQAGYVSQGHTVEGNDLDGYATSINDNSYADTSSFSVIQNNAVTGKIRQPANNYQGVVVNNRVLRRPLQAPQLVTF